MQIFEEKMARLEEITDLMQNPNTKLQEAISLLKEGSQLVDEMNKELDDADAQIKILLNAEGDTLGDFSDE